jgi:tripartite-type tricarboxylate transporter receptor subunit TctC
MRSLRAAGHLTICALVQLAPTAALSPVAAQEEFYRGKTVNIIIGYSVGGGYDTYARLLGRYIGKYIPGKPAVVPQNMPGAGSIKALEYLLKVAPKDGLTFGTFGRSLPLSPLLEDAKYDATGLEWIGSITADTSTCLAWHTTGIKSLEDLRTKPFTGGGLGKGSDPDIFTAVLKNSFGFNVKLVSGYPGTKDLVLALERGEIDGICGYTYSSIRSGNKGWLENKRVVFMAQIGLVRDKELPEVPLLQELAKTGLQKQAMTLISLSQSVARPFALPPGTDNARVKTLRDAFDATMKDGEFLAEANKAALEVTPYSGAQVADLIRKAYASPPEVIAEARRAIRD